MCRVPLSVDTTVFTCTCGTALHQEPEGAEALQCAGLRADCPTCGRPIVLQAGYSHQPEHLDA